MRRHTGRKIWIPAFILAFAAGAFVVMPGAYSQTGYGQVTLVNQTKGTLDLYTNGHYSCRALKGLSCTSQERAGSISLVAKTGDVRSAAVIDSLKSGGSYTWTIDAKSTARTSGGSMSPELQRQVKTDNYTGIWTVNYSGSWGTNSSRLSIIWDPESHGVTGRASDSCGSSRLSGKINPQSRSAVINKSYNSGDCRGMTFQYSGSISSNGKFSGVWSGAYAPPNDKGNFEGWKN